MPTFHNANIADRTTQDFARPARDEIPDTYPKGRVCTEHGCITRLSVYNHGPYCYCHAAKHEIHADVEPVDPFGPLFVPLYRAPVTF